MLYAAYDPIPQPRFTRIKSCLHIPITIHKSNSHNTMLLPVPSLGNTTSSVMKRNRHTNIMVTQKTGNQSIFRAIMTETLSKIDQNVHRLNQLHARSVHIATWLVTTYKPIAILLLALASRWLIKITTSPQLQVKMSNNTLTSKNQ